MGRAPSWVWAGCVVGCLWGAPVGAAAGNAHGAAPQSQPATQRVDINRAGVAELMRLPNIGKSRAQAIIAYRDKRPFAHVTELMRIKGIGRRTFAKLRPWVYVGPPPQGAGGAS